MKHVSFVEFKGSFRLKFTLIEFSGLAGNEPLVGGIKIWWEESTGGTFPVGRDE